MRPAAFKARLITAPISKAGGGIVPKRGAGSASSTSPFNTGGAARSATGTIVTDVCASRALSVRAAPAMLKNFAMRYEEEIPTCNRNGPVMPHAPSRALVASGDCSAYGPHYRHRDEEGPGLPGPWLLRCTAVNCT